VLINIRGPDVDRSEIAEITPKPDGSVLIEPSDDDQRAETIVVIPPTRCIQGVYPD
jgi:hypothetical protein